MEVKSIIEVSNCELIRPVISQTPGGGRGVLPIMTYTEAAWPSGQLTGLAIRRSRVRVPALWPLAGFFYGSSEFNSSATLVN